MAQRKREKNGCNKCLQCDDFEKREEEDEGYLVFLSERVSKLESSEPTSDYAFYAFESVVIRARKVIR